MRQFILFLLTGFCFLHAATQTHNLVPQPREITVSAKGEKFILNPASRLVLQGSGLEHAASFFNEYLGQYYGFTLPVADKPSEKNDISLNYERMDHPIPGAYLMKVGKKGVYIGGDNAQGVFYGIQTLIQLLPLPATAHGKPLASLSIPFVTIRDAPRFGYRGMHLDVGRHFFPVSFVKKYIDYLALHKFNTFHFHLTEDQGWRIEIKKYPRLTEVGGWRHGTIIGRYPGTGNDNIRHGGYYTQEEIKDIVRYAATRHIDVVPEIEMPGHAGAAIAAYPELSCFPEVPTIRYFPANQVWAGDSTGKQVQQTWGVFEDVFCAGKENCFSFLQDVLDEVIPLFPSQYVHIGGDECPKENWKKCPHCQQRMKDHGLKDEHELQSYFIQRMEKYINGKGKRMIGWDEILEGGLAPNAIVMSWRGEEGGIAAAKEKHEVIMTPGGWVYFDHSQSQNEDSVTIGGFTTLEKVYGYEPIPAALQGDESKYVLGAQANLWTEYIKNTRKVEYMVFPRMAALSEVLWSPKEKRNAADFERRLKTQFKRYDLWKINYSKAFYDISSTVSPAPGGGGLLWKLDTKQKPSKLFFRVNEGKEMPYTKPITVKSNSTIETWAVADDGTKGKAVKQVFHYNKATGKKIMLAKEPSRNYPGNGALTLVDGIHNERGLARSREFLGWSGDDLEATIDLGAQQPVSAVVVHSLSSGGSWIYPPAYAEVFVSLDGKDFTPAGKTTDYTKTNGSNGILKISFAPRQARYLKVVVKNYGIIPEGRQGAGNKAWLFADELEVM